MGYPERNSNIPRHEIKEIKVLSQRESGIGGPVPKELVDYSSCCDALSS